MIGAFQIKPAQEKKDEISNLLTGYWKNDIWKADDIFFDDFPPQKWLTPNKRVNFSTLPTGMKNEVKFIFALRLLNREIQLFSVMRYGLAIKRLGEFTSTYYPNVLSIVDIPFDKALVQWRTFLIESGAKVNKDGKLTVRRDERFFNQLYSFFVNFYDTREETEKDIWDLRKIHGTRITENKSNYLLDFTAIPMPYRNLVKRYLKFRITIVSQSQASDDLMSLRLFLNFIYKEHQTWKNLKNLTRNNMESIYLGLGTIPRTGRDHTSFILHNLEYVLTTFKKLNIRRLLICLRYCFCSKKTYLNRLGIRKKTSSISLKGFFSNLRII